MSPKRVAGLVIFRQYNQIIQFLLLQTTLKQQHWTPPMGQVDLGETDWLTALRETKEEAGLSETDLEIYKDISKTLKLHVKGKPKVIVYWLAKLKDPEQKVILSNEHQDFKWLPLQPAQEITENKYIQDLLAEFHENALIAVQ